MLLCSSEVSSRLARRSQRRGADGPGPAQELRQLERRPLLPPGGGKMVLIFELGEKHPRILT